MTDTNNSSPTRSPYKRYTLIDKTFTSRYEFIADEDIEHEAQAPIFVAKYSYFKRHKPDLILHAGQDEKENSAVACAWTFTHTMGCKLGVGDICNEYSGNTQWEEYKPANVGKTKWRWSFTLPDRSVSLLWKGTSHHAVDGKRLTAWSMSNWKLVAAGDEKTILAVFTGRPGLMTVCGTLQINVDWGERFNHLVLITLVLLRRPNNPYTV